MEWPNTHAHLYEDIHTHQNKKTKKREGVGREEGKKEGKKQKKEKGKGKQKRKERERVFGRYRSGGKEEGRTSY
jgi:hypothetical protein